MQLWLLKEAFKNSGSLELSGPPVSVCGFQTCGQKKQVDLCARQKGEKSKLFAPLIRNKIAFLKVQ